VLVISKDEPKIREHFEGAGLHIDQHGSGVAAMRAALKAVEARRDGHR